MSGRYQNIQNLPKSKAERLLAQAEKELRNVTVSTTLGSGDMLPGHQAEIKEMLIIDAGISVAEDQKDKLVISFILHPMMHPNTKVQAERMALSALKEFFGAYDPRHYETEYVNPNRETITGQQLAERFIMRVLPPRSNGYRKRTESVVRQLANSFLRHIK